MLNLYTDYLISQTSYATATGLSSLVNGDISHDQVSYFLRIENFAPKHLWLLNKPQLREIQTAQDGVLLLDDTIEEKSYTDENNIVCWHYSHAKGRCVKGINLLNCMVRYGDHAVPVGYEVIEKDLRYSDLETKRVKRKASISKNEHFCNLVKQAVENGVLFDFVLADNWFGSRANMLMLHHELNKHFIIGIKSNRCVALSKEAQERGQYQQANSLEWKSDECRCVYLKDLSIPVKLLKKVFKNEDGSTGILYLVTNALSIDADRMYEVYQKRWRIEEFHKSIKQNASLEKSPTKVVKTQMNHIFCSMMAYCKLEKLKMKTTHNHFAIRHKLLIKANQAAFAELQKIKRAA